jgi:hypothetical protein
VAQPREDCQLSPAADKVSRTQGSEMGQNRPSVPFHGQKTAVSSMPRCQRDVPQACEFNGSVECLSAGGPIPNFIHTASVASTAAHACQGRNMMNGRTRCMLTGITVLGLAITALPQASLAQSDPLARALAA